MLMTYLAPASRDDGPTRDYIAGMAGELARLARDAGDRRLALALDLAATFAELPRSRAVTAAPFADAHVPESGLEKRVQ